MKSCGLSRSDSSRDVLLAGEKFFGKNSWEVDPVFFRLIRAKIKTRSQIERYYRSLNSGRKLRWSGHRKKQYRRILWKLVDQLEQGSVHVALQAIRDPKDVFISLVSLENKKGRLAKELREERIWVGIGLEFDPFNSKIELWSGIEFDIDSFISSSLAFRESLIKQKYYASYDDNEAWERHYKTLTMYKDSQNPLRLEKKLTKAIIKETVKIERIFKVLG